MTTTTSPEVPAPEIPAIGPNAVWHGVPTPAGFDPENLKASEIDAIVHLRVRPPACIRSLTLEKQLIWLKREQDQAIARLEADPEIEERAVPRRNPDGTLARDPKNGRILYDVERVPVAEREVVDLEKMIEQVRSTYAAQLKVGPEARAARADAEARYLAQQFGSPEEQRAVPRQIVADVSAAFRRLKGW